MSVGLFDIPGSGIKSAKISSNVCCLNFQYNSWFVYSEYGVRARKPVHAHQLEMVYDHWTSHVSLFCFGFVSH